MKFKKDEMIRLSPRVVADYLQSHGWRLDQDVASKGAIWLRHDQGDEYEIMLPTNREMGDFAIRMSEAIFTLGAAENRNLHDVYSTLTQIRALPSEIFEGEIAAEHLQWISAEKAKLELPMKTLNATFLDGHRGNFLASLVEIAEVLARGTALIGNETAQMTAVWRSCERVLVVAGWPVKDNLSAKDFWNSARAGEAETWFDICCAEPLATPIPNDPAPRHG